MKGYRIVTGPFDHTVEWSKLDSVGALPQRTRGTGALELTGAAKVGSSRAEGALGRRVRPCAQSLSGGSHEAWEKAPIERCGYSSHYPLL